MQTLKTIRNAAILAIVAMSVTAPITQAASPDVAEVNVTFDARDFSTETGVSEIYRKLRLKANQACITNGRKALADKIAERNCAADLLTDLVLNTNNTELLRLHRAITG